MEQAFEPIKLISEIESLKVDEGPLIGKGFTVLDWQKKIIEALSVSDEVFLTMGRGAGKSSFCAAIAVSAITPGGALFVPRGQIILAASSMNQAKFSLWSHIKGYMKDTLYVVDERDGHLKVNTKIWRIADHSHAMQIQHKETGTILHVIGSDPKRAHGLAPSLVILDEPAQHESGGNLLYAALSTGDMKQENCRVFVIGTRPRSPLHYFAKMLKNPPDNSTSFYYANDLKDLTEENMYSDEVMRKSNPSFDHIPTVKKAYRKMADSAKTSPEKKAQYLALYLNTGTLESDGLEEVIDMITWKEIVKQDVPDRRGKVCVGIDLGGGNSLTAIAFYWWETGRLEAYGAVPEEPSLQERGERDGIGSAYCEMKEDGVLFIHGQKETRNADFVNNMISPYNENDIEGIACDRYKVTAVRQALYDCKIDERLLVDRAVGRGSDGWSDLSMFQESILEGHLKPGINLALEHAITSAVVKRDNNGNASLDKSHQRGRIDVLQSVVHAVGLGERIRKPPEMQREFNASMMAFGV